MAELIKKLAYSGMQFSGAFAAARRMHRRQALILTYHGVLQEPGDNYVNRNCVSAEMFERQVRWLKKHYEVMPLADLADALAGRRQLPDNAAAITFDDGFRNNFSVAFPILLKLNAPATIFTTTDFIDSSNQMLWTERVDSIIYSATGRRLRLQMNGELTVFDVSTVDGKISSSDRIRGYLKTQNPQEREKQILSLERQIDERRDFLENMAERYDFLSWDEIRTMTESGLIEIGSHTCSHSILATLSAEDLKTELLNSKMAIEAQLNKECRLFSYPNGTTRDFSSRDQRALQETGFRAAFSQISGYNKPGEAPYGLKRINIVRSPSFAFFQAKASGVWSLMKKMRLS